METIGYFENNRKYIEWIKRIYYNDLIYITFY